MRSHHITLSEPVSRMVESQIKCGRFKDFSAAIQEAVWNYFQGVPDAAAEYGLTAEEVDKAFDRDMAEIKKERKQGKLKAFDL